MSIKKLDLECNTLSAAFRKFFSTNALKKLAKDSGVIVRERKIKAHDFVKNVIFAATEEGTIPMKYIKSLFADFIC